MSTGVGAVGLLTSVPAASRVSHPSDPAFPSPTLRTPPALRTPSDQAFQVATINERLHSLARKAGFDPGKVDITV